MNKVITINLGGMAYQLEEGGYDALRDYLETATARLQGNPDREEILSDIESAIGEKFRALLASHKNVVTGNEVAAVLADMGPIEAEPGASATGAAGGPEAGQPAGGVGTAGARSGASAGGLPRRLYRIHEGEMIAGVCNGLGAYLGVDPTFVRLAFVLLAIFWGTGVLVYFIMAIVIPAAQSPEEKAAASGIPATAQEYIRRAREGYYDAMKKFPDRAARRAWKRQFKRDLRAVAGQWRSSWHGALTPPAPVHPGLGFTLPLLSLLQGVLSVVWVCAIISLLATGAVFGLALPANVPVWVAALLLLIVYGILAAPVKAARRMCRWSLGQPQWAWPFVFLADALVWLILVVVLLWLGAHFFPDVREAIQSLPKLLHEAADDIRNWWHATS